MKEKRKTLYLRCLGALLCLLGFGIIIYILGFIGVKCNIFLWRNYLFVVSGSIITLLCFSIGSMFLDF